MELELSYLSLKIQFLSSLSEDELDKVMFFFANFDGDSESGADEEVLEECEAYGVTWDEIISFMARIKEREANFLKSNKPSPRVYSALSFFSARLFNGEDIFRDLANMLHASCGIKKDAILALSIAREALFADTRSIGVGARVFAGGGQ